MITKIQRIDLPLDDHRLCARVAHLYYESELTQEEIGRQLGLSRMKVNRLLKLATKVGVVKIRIVDADEPYVDLVESLTSTFGLRDAKVVGDPVVQQQLRPALAAGAAAWLAEQLADGLVIGIGLGRTVALLPATFSVPRPVGCQFVTLEGVGVSPDAGFAAYDVTSRLAEAAGGRAEVISAPTFVSSRAVRDALLAEPTVGASLDIARGAGLMLQSVGTVSIDALLFRHGTLGKEDLARLQRAGAVGDALGHFFDAEGAHVPWPTDDVHIGLTLDEIRNCPTSALVAGGEAKVPAVRAALRGGLANVLITNAGTAERLLERAA
jgi:DNA-binding transcriptional regulator LsrR (DeoR family)